LYKLLGHHAGENGAKRRKLIAIEEQEERTSQECRHHKNANRK
jgi:hypothetical protein